MQLFVLGLRDKGNAKRATTRQNGALLNPAYVHHLSNDRVQRLRGVVPMRVEDSPCGVDLDLVVVTVVARIHWLEHDLDCGGAGPQVRIRIVAKGETG